jgi:hypothetical protein
MRIFSMKLFTLLFFSTLYLSAAYADETLTIELIDQPAQKWNLQNVTVEATEKGAQVSGLLTAFHRFGLPSGHLSILACSPTDELIALTTSDTPPFLTSRDMKQGGIRFAVEFEQALPADTIIKVTFHRGPIRSKPDPDICRKLASDSLN